MDKELLSEFVEAVHSTRTVSGLTHNFYRYPARFSPLFVRAAIRAFTKPGELVLDPFAGSGTTLVEARVTGRRAIGVDISSLATFLARVKTSVFSNREIDEVLEWAIDVAESTNTASRLRNLAGWSGREHADNVGGKLPWPIRKFLEGSLTRVTGLSDLRQQRFARCILLKAGQWALDCRDEIPAVSEFRERLLLEARSMADGAREFARCAKNSDRQHKLEGHFRTLCLQRSAVGMHQDVRLKGEISPRLILTSPPYPGVHVLYHRWQIQGRRETSAPFWILGAKDGNGASFYTLGDRKQRGQVSYFEQLRSAFESLRNLANSQTTVIQQVAFPEPSKQLPRYLATLNDAGFHEVLLEGIADSSDGRLWRSVPNRKWYATAKGSIPTSKEVVLLHRLK